MRGQQKSGITTNKHKMFIRRVILPLETVLNLKRDS